MKENIAVLTDTNSGISPELAKALGIYLVPMPVIIDRESYFEGISISQDEFFRRLGLSAQVSSSQPAPGVLLDCWESLLESYEKVVYLPMSSGLSGACGTATMLAQEHDGRVLVVDDRRISVTLRQSVLKAKRMADLGCDAAQIVAQLEEDGPQSAIYIAVNTLELLKRSGRVTAAGAALSTVLNIKPVLQIQGSKLDAFKVSRGMKQAMQTMTAALKQDQSTRFAGERIGIRAAYSGDKKAGVSWQSVLQEAFPELDIGLDPLPLSIACHTGYGALGVGIMKEDI